MKRLAGLALLAALAATAPVQGETTVVTSNDGTGGATTLETATLGGGCFWCVEAVFEQVKGVKSVVSGYSGGQVPNPTYQQVCSGDTGHAEAVQITFDPAQISLAEILTVFFGTHDPTTPNRQGADVGTQYRSAIFYHDEQQQEVAQQVIADLEREQVFSAPVVTEVAPFAAFYPAEDHHQEYYERNSNQAYCQVVIAPKLQKLRQKYSDLLKR